MKKLLISEIKEFTKGKFINKQTNAIINSISIDSREVDKRSLFIPIIGENNDGHIFMEDAYNNGCRNFIIDKKHKFIKNDINLLQVKNTTHAYGDIAKGYKNKINVLTIGVTGSVGKTSTKDIIYSVLCEKYNTLKNDGNLNNEIGVPKTCFNLDNTYNAFVSEISLSKKGDIKSLVDIVNPSIAVISNIGMSHIQNFKDQQGIFEAKMEITDKFNKDSLLIINGDDIFLKKLKEKDNTFKVLSYGFDESNDICCVNYEIKEESTNFICTINNKKEKFVIPSVAKHNIYNAMAAILVGLNCDIKIAEIKKGLKKIEITKGRLTIKNLKDIVIIDDSYNASADSTISALSVLSTYKKRRVAILGDILETGKFDKEIHEKIGRNIKNNVDFLITVGESSKIIEESAIADGFNKDNTEHYKNYKELIKDIEVLIEKGDVVLVKASHGIELDKVVEYLDEKYE